VNVSDLPRASPQSPACGVCGGETYDDVDRYVCQSCRLSFDAGTFEASFLNPGDPVCGEPCRNQWHGDGLIYPGLKYRCGVCLLPAGHESFHWTGCEVSP
jgi:hypothetical protein